jgi:hypothetical protein
LQATLRTPFSTSQRAISRRSAVKHPRRRTGSGSRSGLIATQCSLPPTSTLARIRVHDFRCFPVRFLRERPLLSACGVVRTHDFSYFDQG